MRVGSLHLLSVAVTILPSGALAQAVPPPDVARPTREEVSPPTQTERPPQSRARVDAGGAFERAPCPLETSEVRATISRVQFTGPGGAPLAPELLQLLSSIGAPNSDQPIKVVCDLRDRANAALRKARYVATVQVPPQRIEDGTLRLEVVSARIVEMRVRGEPGPYEARIQQSIEGLKRLDPLNEAEAERLLLLVGDTPGLDVQLSLRPTGATPGDVIGEMTVSYNRFSVIANAQNYNSRQLGRETGYVRAEVYGLTGASDTTYIGLSSTADLSEQKIVQVGHVAGLDDKGTTLGSRLTYAISQPDLDQLRLQTKSFIASVELARPLVRSVRANLGLTTGFEFAQQRTDILGANARSPLNLDRVSNLFLRAVGDLREFSRFGEETIRTGASLEIRQGLNILNATQTGRTTPAGYFPSRFEGSATATVIRGQIDSRIGLGPIFNLTGTVRGQWSNRALLNFDEFAVGNLTIGRGYDPGANSGDRAVGASVELRAKIVRGTRLTVEPFGFYDAVRIWNLDRNSTENNRSLRSYGGGVRVVLPGLALLEVTYAKPIDRALSFDRTPPPDRVLASLTMQLVPFGGRR